MAARAKNDDALTRLCAAAAVLASGVMAARVMVEVGVVHLALLPQVAPAMTGVIGGALLAFLVAKRSAARTDVKTTGTLTVQNPFALSSAAFFALMYGVVLVVTKVATVSFGTTGVLVAGVLAGATDVDAITLSMAALAKSGAVSDRVAASAILLAVASNTVVKTGLAIAIGGWRFGRFVVVAALAMLALGALGLLPVLLG
jgi:uncharacterized membrane protein (DUF4010 family)